jgi:DNA-binding transcriptional LysR family regulator
MSHTNSIEYGRKLIHAGVTGIRTGHSEFDAHKAHALVTRSAEESLRLALAGACLGVVPGCLLARRSRAGSAALFGVLGSVLGFVTAFSWKTRSLSSTLAHSAFKEVRRTKDEHWLENNPIDYA